MKTTVKSVSCLKVTVYITRNGTLSSASKTFLKAHKAATFYSLYKNQEWWNDYSQIAPVGQGRYVQKDARQDRLYRRALQVFTRYLP